MTGSGMPCFVFGIGYVWMEGTGEQASRAKSTEKRMARTSASLSPTNETSSTLNSLAWPFPRLSTHAPRKVAEHPTVRLRTRR